MYRTSLLAATLVAIPAIVQAQTSDPIIEISANHGHIFTLENSQARIIKAWPGAFEAFDFGEHPNIPNAKFIFVKLKPGAKLDSTTLTLIIDEGGKEITKNYILKRISGIPTQTSTLIGNQPIVAAKPEPVTITQPFTPPSSIPAPQAKQEGEKPEKLKVSKEFSAFSGGASKAVDSKPEKTLRGVAQAKPSQGRQDSKNVETPKRKELKLLAKIKPQPSSESLSPIRPFKAKEKTKVETEKQLIERSSLNQYAVASYLLKGLYRAENLKQISDKKPQFWQAQSTARLLRRGYSVEKSLKLSGLPPTTFDNLLAHGGVGR
ncbi:MAG: hypothetical protein HC851_20290 [Acaryochloris sp. RU_4_1]|nr:hypothetical protein [Acaryochloris sp. RU_4_1]NJR56193.1 hypothetical protein [Acaryochloris sp. CRU_2_0]